MDKVNTFLILLLAAVLMAFGYYALNNNPKTIKEVEIQKIIKLELKHDTIYKERVRTIRDSFKVYVSHRDSVLIDSTKIDSVLATKIDTNKNLKISAIEIKDSLNVCTELLSTCTAQVAHKDSVFGKIDSINNKKENTEIPWKTYGIVGILSFVLGVAVSN